MPSNGTNNGNGSPNDRIHFRENHRPVLEDGLYEVSLNHSLTSDVTVVYKSDPPVSFAIFGPRFTLHETDVQAVFPPSGVSGKFDEVLPHIILNRDTLPWERSPLSSSVNNAPPWLALLVFTEADNVTVTPTTVSEAQNRIPNTLPSLRNEPGDDINAPATVIDVPGDRLLQLLPTFDELSFLSHVRVVVPPNTSPTAEPPTAEPAGVSVVLANRFPPKGKAITVHLVSLEGLYSVSSGTTPSLALENSNTSVRLISLYSWSFFCQESLGDDFDRILNRVNRENTPTFPGSLASGLPGSIKPPELEFQLPSNGISGAAKQFLDNGCVPLTHRFRQGDTSVSWYHGPFVPHLAGENGTAKDVIKLPARASDALLIFDSSTGVFDVSYAAAWEIGRLLMLQNTRIATSLYEWKRSQVQAQRHRDASPGVRHLPQLSTGSQVTSANGDIENFADERLREIVKWFDEELLQLKSLPFRYLVPDDNLLPPESLRFFVIDKLWMDCLFDGAFSVSRHTENDLQLENEAQLDKALRDRLPDAPASSGLILRSAVVAGWPGITIDAYSGQPPEKLPSDPSTPTLNVLRRELLSPTVLILLFGDQRPVNTVDFHLSPESLHFGKPRSASIKLSDVELGDKIVLRNPAELGVLDVMASAKMPAPNEDQSLNSERFAFKLVAQVPVVRFIREA